MIHILPGPLRRPNGSGRVAEFCLDQREVTAEEYKMCVERGACDDGGLECDDEWTYGKPERANHPINCVSWQQANEYCRDAGKRLPSFEEWEWAAQGGDEGRRFAWGDSDPEPDQMCWAKASKPKGTCAVSSFPQSRTLDGVDDMFGNVWEWLSPPEREGIPNVARGGSWHNDSIDTLEGENAGGFMAGFVRNDVVGFRCARAQ
jgi:sulfatase modifying factor 1